jgi:hypothetical protein
MKEIIQSINNKFTLLLNEYNEKINPARVLDEEMQAQLVKRGCFLYGKKLLPVFLKPVFIDESQLNDFIHASNFITRILEKMTDLYFTEPELRDLFLLKPQEMELVEIDPGVGKKIWITRNDALVTDTGICFYEFNCDSPGGPMYFDLQMELIEQTNIIKELSKEYDLRTSRIMPQIQRALSDAYFEFCHFKGITQKEKPRIAIVANKQSVTYPEFLMITEWFQEHGYHSCFQDPRELHCDRNSNLMTEKGDSIDIVYRRGRLSDWTDHMEEIKPLLKSYKAGKVCIINPPRSILGSHKHLIGLIQEDRFCRFFTQDENDAIHRYLPWTKLMAHAKVSDWNGQQVDLYEFVRKNRDALVLKPIYHTLGTDVCIGKCVDQDTWESFIEKTTRYNYVVQRFISISEELFPVVEPALQWIPKVINLNFFTMNHQYTGGFPKISANQTISSSQNFGFASLFSVHGAR